jgi:methionyl-tRNA formyltransferase
LPRWRGAAPIQASILSGDHQTGVTIMHMDPGVDTGPILSQRTTPISAEDTAGTLGKRLAQLGADLLIETLPAYLQGSLIPRQQDPSQATLAPMLKKEDGLLDLSQPAEALARRVRAFQPWPGAFLPWEGMPLKILRASAVDTQDAKPGQRLIHSGNPAIQTGLGTLVLEEVQPAGKKPMPGRAFLQGARDWEK